MEVIHELFSKITILPSLFSLVAAVVVVRLALLAVVGLAMCLIIVGALAAFSLGEAIGIGNPAFLIVASFDGLIGKDLVCLIDFLKQVFLALGGVWVVLLGEFAEGTLDVLLLCTFSQVEHLVIVLSGVVGFYRAEVSPRAQTQSMQHYKQLQLCPHYQAFLISHPRATWTNIAY